MNKIKVEKIIRYATIEKFGQLEKGEVLARPDEIYYDENGNEIEVWYYNVWFIGSSTKNGTYYKYTYKYDENGNRIVECCYREGFYFKGRYYKIGRINYKYTYRYDENGNIIEECRYNKYGKFSYKYTYEYDENGNNIEKK